MQRPTLRRMKSFHESVREQQSKFISVQARRFRKTPRWVKFLRKIYHQYGLKHLMLITILLIYQFMGAAIFYFIEAGVETTNELHWREEINENRSTLIRTLIPAMFNNTEYFLFLSAEQTTQMFDMLDFQLNAYEVQLGIKYGHQKIKWDFWNAMLYAGTICTTIGYGHLYPNTTSGRLLTMVYAIFGIPLVLSILDDLGKLLTKCMKYPWFVLKMGCRRIFRICTKQSMEEIKRVDDEDRKDLEIFDLPIPVAIGIVIGWIFICSATFCLWEKEWDYFVAFYFFFISLSTIGLGDITPKQPKYLLMLFGYIIVGLSLVSMCINLIQAKLENTYAVGEGQEDLSEAPSHYSKVLADHHSQNQSPRRPLKRIESKGGKEVVKISTLGILQRHSSHSLSSRGSGASPTHHRREVTRFEMRHRASKLVQTLLSIPSPSKRMRASQFRQNLLNSLSNGVGKGKIIPTSLSIDDVMRLVDTEVDDVLILQELSATYSFDSNNVATTHADVARKAKIDETEVKFIDDTTSLLAPPPGGMDLEDIEEIEELEDQILLGTSDYGRKSRSGFGIALSVDEHRPAVIHEEEEEDMDDSPRPTTSARFPQRYSFPETGVHIQMKPRLSLQTQPTIRKPSKDYAGIQQSPATPGSSKSSRGSPTYSPFPHAMSGGIPSTISSSQEIQSLIYPATPKVPRRYKMSEPFYDVSGGGGLTLINPLVQSPIGPFLPFSPTSSPSPGAPSPGNGDQEEEVVRSPILSIPTPRGSRGSSRGSKGSAFFPDEPEPEPLVAKVVEFAPGTDERLEDEESIIQEADRSTQDEVEMEEHSRSEQETLQLVCPTTPDTSSSRRTSTIRDTASSLRARFFNLLPPSPSLSPKLKSFRKFSLRKGTKIIISKDETDEPPHRAMSAAGILEGRLSVSAADQPSSSTATTAATQTLTGGGSEPAKRKAKSVAKL